MTNKIRVGLLYGGKSVEHEISLRSARNVYEQMDRSKFDPVLVGITKDGKWYLVDSMDQPISSGRSISLSLGHSDHTFSSTTGPGSGKLDVVFPVLHGTDGEDGSIQGLLQAADIPCTGSDVLGSSVAMDKHISKQLLQKEGIPTCRFVAISQGGEVEVSFDQIVREVGLPFMVKPISLGSSVGVTKINNEPQFEQALKDTLQYDQGLLAEEFISGRELECAILGNQEAKSSDPGEIIISPKYDFYSYDAKYEDPDAVEIKVPATLEQDIKERIKALCLQSYQVLRCNDFARVDLFLTADNGIYINEINTIPGFTNSSMFPALWAQHGIDYSSLITKIIELALERYESKKKLNRNYLGTATG